MAEPTYNFKGLRPKAQTALPSSLLPTEKPKSKYNFSGLKRKPEQFGPPAPEGFVPPEPPSAFEKAISGAKEVVSDIDKYLGEQVLAPAALKAKRAISGVLPEPIRKITGFEMTPEQLKKAEETGAPIIPLSKFAPAPKVIEKLPVPSYRWLAAIGKGALEVAEGLTTAENVALISALGGAPKAVQSAVSAGFAYMMGKELPTQWQAFKEAKTESEKIRLATHAATTLGLTAAAAAHTVTGIKAAIEEPRIAKQRAVALPELERAGAEAETITRVAEREKATKAEQQKYEPVTAEEIRKRAVMDITDLNAKLAKGQKIHPNDQKALNFLRENLENPDALARAYKLRVESPEVVEQFANERAAKIKEKTEAEVKKQEEAATKERQKVENLETPQLRMQAVADQLAFDEFKKPFEELSVAEKNTIRERSASEYSRRLKSISKELEATDETLRGARNRVAREKQAQEILRQRLVEERAARTAPAEAPPAEVPTERGLVTIPRELRPEEVEIIPTRELPPPPEVTRGRITTPVRGELPGVTQTVTPAVETRRGEYVGEIPEIRVPPSGEVRRKPLEEPSAEELPPEEVPPPEPIAPKVPPAELTPAQRKERLAQETLDLKEQQLKFRREQQAEKERVVAEKKAEKEQKRREALAEKLGEKFGEEKVTLAKEKKPEKVAPAPEAEKTFDTQTGKKKPSEVFDDDLYDFENTFLEKGAKAKASAEKSGLNVKDPFEQNANTERIRGGIHDLENQLRVVWDEQLRRGLIEDLPLDYADPFNIRGGKPIKPFANTESFARLGWGKPKEAPKPKVEKAPEKQRIGKAPVTAETKPITGKEPIKGQPPTGKPAVTEVGKEPVAARPTEPKAEVTKSAEKITVTPPKVERPISPALAKLRPSEQFEKAKTAIDKIKRTEGWQDRARKVLEKEGYPSRIIDELTAPTRFARPSEPFSPEFATTREGRVERAVEPPKELKSKVDKIADAGRRNQIAQARYDKAREELLAEIKKEGKEGIVAEIDTKGNFKITVKDPDALTESTKAAIKKIQQAEIDKGSFKPKMVSTELQIAVAPGAEALKGLELKGALAAKVAETVLRKEQAKKTEIVFDKLKGAYKNDLFDYYLTHEPGALLGKTKEGLPTEVLIRRAPSVKGAGKISELAGRQITTLKAIDRTHTETGTALLESAKNRANWEDKMVARFGKAIKPKLSDIWDTVQYIKENKHLDIRSIGEKLTKETDRTRFKFIRKTLSEADQAKFDAVLDKIKATDVEILSKANDFGTVLAGTAKQYANYAEFGYWTLKSLGKAGLNKAAWAAKMIEGMGEKIKPFLDDLWDKIHQRDYRPGTEFTGDDLPKVFRDVEIKQPKIKVAESSLPDDPPEAKLPKSTERAAEPEKKISKPTPGIGYYIEPVVQIVERSHKKVAHGFRQAIDYWENKEGSGEPIIRPLARKLRFRPTALNRIDDFGRKDNKLIWDNWHEWQTKPGTRPQELSKIEKQALDAYDRLLENRKEILEEAGVNPKRIPDLIFKRVPSFDLLDAIRSESGTVWNTLVSELARINSMPIEKVQSALRRYRFDRFEEFPTHLEIGTGGIFGKDIVPIQATQGVSALRALNRDTARISGLIKIFGEDYSTKLREIRKEIDPEFQKYYDLMTDAYYGVRRLETDRSMGKRILLNLVQPVVRTALLARSAFYQPTQIVGGIRLVSSKVFLKGLYDLTRKGTKAELEAIGAYAPAILDMAWQKGQRIEDLGRILSEVGGNVTLLKPAIEMTDLGITAGFRRFALDIKERGGKLKPREKNTLEVLNFTPEQIKLVDKYGFEGYNDAEVMFSSVVNRGRKAVTFTGKKGPEMTRFQLNPMMMQLFQFQGYNVGQMQQASTVVTNLKNRLKTIGTAKTPDEKSAAKRQLLSAVNQAGVLFTGTLAAAEANQFMRALINGQDLDRPEDWRRLFDDLLETGWTPFLREISYGFASEPSKLTLPGSIVSEAVDAWKGRFAYRDREGYERAAMFLDKYTTKPYTQGFDLLKNMMVATGLLEGNPTLKTAIRHYWSFLDKNKAFSPSKREGYNEAQAAIRGMLEAIKDSEPGTFNEATRQKIFENVAKAIKAKTIELAEKGLDPIEAAIEAKKRIRSGLLNRRTLTDIYKEEKGYFEIGNKKLSREQIDEELRGGKYTDALLIYDRLLKDLADSL